MQLADQSPIPSRSLQIHRWMNPKKILPLILTLMIPLGACQLSPKISKANTVVPNPPAQASEISDKTPILTEAAQQNNAAILQDLKGAKFIYLGEVS